MLYATNTFVAQTPDRAGRFFPGYISYKVRGSQAHSIPTVSQLNKQAVHVDWTWVGWGVSFAIFQI